MNLTFYWGGGGVIKDYLLIIVSEIEFQTVGNMRR